MIELPTYVNCQARTSSLTKRFYRVSHPGWLSLTVSPFTSNGHDVCQQQPCSLPPYSHRVQRIHGLAWENTVYWVGLDRIHEILQGGLIIQYGQHPLLQGRILFTAGPCRHSKEKKMHDRDQKSTINAYRYNPGLWLQHSIPFPSSQVGNVLAFIGGISHKQKSTFPRLFVVLALISTSLGIRHS